jgi:AcrR family transcriptional regulator
MQAAMKAHSGADRRTRKREKSRVAILDAAAQVMSEKGIDEATMAEISELADVALGTLYNHFDSKEDLAIAVVDAEIEQVARLIEERTADFADPAMVFAFGVRTVIEHATTNDRWRQLLDSPEVIARSFFSGFGPYAIRDVGLAVDAGRFHVVDLDLAWWLAAWAIIGFSSAVYSGEVDPDASQDTVVAILGIVGMDSVAARELVARVPNQLGSQS